MTRVKWQWVGQAPDISQFHGGSMSTESLNRIRSEVQCTELTLRTLDDLPRLNGRLPDMPGHKIAALDLGCPWMRAEVSRWLKSKIFIEYYKSRKGSQNTGQK